MKTHDKIFRENFIEHKIKTEFKITKEELEKKKNIIQKWINFIKNKEIYNYNEEQLQEKFTNTIFKDLLEYTDIFQNNECWNIELEMRTDLDGQKPDATFGYFEKNNKKVCAVLELKDPTYRDLDKKQTRKHDNRTPVEQGFNYTHKYKDGTCRFVIISNFNEIRLYSATSSVSYERFFVEKLEDENELLKFLFIFSKSHILDNNLSSLIELNIKEEEKIEKEFYSKYKKIRFEIIEEIIKNNKEINKEKIIIKTQKLLDRFLFIAFCEDKNFIPANIYKEMVKTSDTFADKQAKFTLLCNFINNGNPKLNINKFNGGLFKEDIELDNLNIPDACFDKLIELANYDFNTDVDENILGRIFEQSLSDLEELKKEYNGEIFDKSKSKRKKDGVYYTPKHITKKIVETAITNYIENKRNMLGKEPDDRYINKKLDYLRTLRKEIINIKIIDPACGSGAFLITAFDILKNEMNKINEQIADLKGAKQELFDGEELYSSSYDTEILKNCLYGVDLNEESVEISKLSLWLRTLSKDKPLTNLDKNIRSGNSLTQFNFKEEFSEVFSRGGFDIVIGNPPYVRHEKITEIKPLLKEKYETYCGTADLYCYFFELGIKILKTGGILGYITSNKWLRINYGENIRRFLNDYFILEIDDYDGIKVFADVGVESNITLIKKINEKNKNIKITEQNKNKTFTTDQNDFNEKAYLFLDNRLKNIKEKIDTQGTPLKDWNVNIYRGILTGLNNAFIINKEKYEELVKLDRKNKEILVPILRGQDIKRYEINYKELYLINTHNGYKNNEAINIENYPHIKKHLNTFEPQLSKRYDKGKTAYNLRNCAYLEEFQKEKIVYGQIINKPEYHLVDSEKYLNDTAFMIVGEKLKYLLALLNSNLIWYTTFNFYAGIKLASGIKLGKNSITKIPIIKPTDEQEKYLTDLAEKLLNTKQKIKNLNEINTLAKKDKNYETQLQTEKEIKQLEETVLDIEYDIDMYVYKMYNITDEEIEILK